MTWSHTRLLAGLMAALALLLALEWLWPDAPPPRAVTPSRMHALAQAAEVPERDTAEWVDTILARPLFSISRKPPRVAAGGRAETAPGQARLAGIMITRAGRRAIFAPEGGGHALVLAEGASVNQSTIRSIFADHVVLASGTVVRPSYDRNRSTATTSVFQPLVPNFAPGIQNPNFPGFAPGGLPPPGFQPAGIPVPQSGADDAAPPGIPQPPAFRGNLIPQRRE